MKKILSKLITISVFSATANLSGFAQSSTQNGEAVLNSLIGSFGTATGDFANIVALYTSLSANQANSFFNTFSPAETAFALSDSVFANKAMQLRNIQTHFDDVHASHSRSGYRFADTHQIQLRETRPLFASEELVVLGQKQEYKWGIFSNLGGIFANQKNRNNLTGYDFRGLNFSIGSDYRVDENLSVGLFLGYDYGKTKVKDPGKSKLDMNIFSIGTCASFMNGGFYMDALAAFSWVKFDIDRRIVATGLNRTAKSKPNGDIYTLYADMGYDFQKGSWVFGPVAAIQFVGLGIDQYTEKGADSLNLKVNRQTPDSLRCDLGMKFDMDMQFKGIEYTVKARTAYQHEFYDDPRSIGAQFININGTPSVTTQTPQSQNDFWNFGLGLSTTWKERYKLSLDYDLLIGEKKFFGQNINACVRIDF